MVGNCAGGGGDCGSCAPGIHVIVQSQVVDYNLHPSVDLFPRLGDGVVCLEHDGKAFSVWSIAVYREIL
jgi:hypothetical protein